MIFSEFPTKSTPSLGYTIKSMGAKSSKLSIALRPPYGKPIRAMLKKRMAPRKFAPRAISAGLFYNIDT